MGAKHSWRRIGVAANSGIVTLTGQVESWHRKHAAEAAAHRVQAYWRWPKNLKSSSFERKRDDGDIAAAIVDRLAWDVSVPRDAAVKKWGSRQVGLLWGC